MKFTLSKSRRYWWPVEVRIPDPDNPGQIVTQTLRVQFEPYSRDEQIAAADRAAEAKTVREAVAQQIEDATAQIKNWDDVLDENGDPLPFSPERLVEALGQSWFLTAIREALTKSLNGEAARLGN